MWPGRRKVNFLVSRKIIIITENEVQKTPVLTKTSSFWSHQYAFNS